MNYITDVYALFQKQTVLDDVLVMIRGWQGYHDTFPREDKVRCNPNLPDKALKACARGSINRTLLQYDNLVIFMIIQLPHMFDLDSIFVFIIPAIAAYYYLWDTKADIDTPAVKYGRIMQQEGVPIDYYKEIVIPKLLAPLMKYDLFGFIADPLAGFKITDFFLDFVHSWIYINQYWIQYEKTDDLPTVTFTQRFTAPDFASNIFNFVWWEMGDGVTLGAQTFVHYIC
jgi:hypothetical protein